MSSEVVWVVIVTFIAIVLLYALWQGKNFSMSLGKRFKIKTHTETPPARGPVAIKNSGVGNTFENNSFIGFDRVIEDNGEGTVFRGNKAKK